MQAKSDALDRYYQTLRTYFHVVLKTKRVIHEMREKYIEFALKASKNDLQSKWISEKLQRENRFEVTEFVCTDQ